MLELSDEQKMEKKRLTRQLIRAGKTNHEIFLELEKKNLMAGPSGSFFAKARQEVVKLDSIGFGSSPDDETESTSDAERDEITKTMLRAGQKILTIHHFLREKGLAHNSCNWNYFARMKDELGIPRRKIGKRKLSEQRADGQNKFQGLTELRDHILVQIRHLGIDTIEVSSSGKMVITTQEKALLEKTFW